jgi:hypothetical protein
MKWDIQAQDRKTGEVIKQIASDKAGAIEIGTWLVRNGYEFVLIWPQGERGWKKRIEIKA